MIDLFVAIYKGVRNMLAATKLSARDLRLRGELEQAFPKSPAFTDYLHEHIVENNGSLEVIREFIVLLNKFVPDAKNVIVSEETVRVHNVHENRASFKELSLSLATGKRGDELIPIIRVFILNIFIRVSMDESKGEDDKRVSITDRSTINPDNHIAFVRIFTCAYAMLLNSERTTHSVM